MRPSLQLLKGGRRLTAATLAIVLAVAVGAFAFWATHGSGSASGSVGTLSAPSISSATGGAESASLSWSSVAAPGSGAVKYYVSRDGGAASGSCPTSSSPSTGDELHRHRRTAGQAQLHGHGRVEVVDRDEQRERSDDDLEPDRRIREPQLARPGRERSNDHDHGLALPERRLGDVLRRGHHGQLHDLQILDRTDGQHHRREHRDPRLHATSP